MNLEALFLISAFDMHAVIGALERQGAASVHVLTEPFRRTLAEEAQRAPYRKAREVVGSGDRLVRQELEYCDDFPPHSAFHTLRQGFRRLLERSLAANGLEAVAGPLKFDSMMLQRYAPGALGITPHRDGRRYVKLVCNFTLAGQGRFCVCADRSGRRPRELDASPGTVILLRAPGFLGTDERPFHFVDNIREERYSFGLRQQRAAPPAA